MIYPRTSALIPAECDKWRSHGKGRGIVEGIRVVKFAIAARTHDRDSRGRKRSGSHFGIFRVQVYKDAVNFLSLARRLEF